MVLWIYGKETGEKKKEKEAEGNKTKRRWQKKKGTRIAKREISEEKPVKSREFRKKKTETIKDKTFFHKGVNTTPFRTNVKIGSLRYTFEKVYVRIIWKCLFSWNRGEVIIIIMCGLFGLKREKTKERIIRGRKGDLEAVRRVISKSSNAKLVRTAVVETSPRSGIQVAVIKRKKEIERKG